MTVKDCYAQLGEDYDEVLRRLGRAEHIQKLLNMLVRDTNVDQLGSALDEENYLAAFHCAHTLKGVYLNMGLTKLATVAGRLTDELRNATEMGDARELYETLSQRCDEMKSAVAKIDE